MKTLFGYLFQTFVGVGVYVGVVQGVKKVRNHRALKNAA